MTFYLVATLLATLVGALVFIPKLQPWVMRQQQGVNFVLTLLATLIGVLLAIAAAEYENERKEREDLQKMLRSAVNSLASSSNYTEHLMHYANTLEPEQQTQLIAKNPPPSADFLKAIIYQPQISKNMSEQSLSDLTELLTNLERSQTKNYAIYLGFLTQAVKTLEVEIQYQSGEISAFELADELKKFEYIPASLPEN